MKLPSKTLPLVFQYNANLMQHHGLISTMAVLLASSSLRMQDGRDINRVCGGASRNLALLNSENGSIGRSKHCLCLLLHLRHGWFEIGLLCIHTLLQQDSLVANHYSPCCRQKRIESFGHNQDELNTQRTGARVQTGNRRSTWIYWDNCWRPERFALKGSEVQSAQWW